MDEGAEGLSLAIVEETNRVCRLKMLKQEEEERGKDEVQDYLVNMIFFFFLTYINIHSLYLVSFSSPTACV